MSLALIAPFRITAGVLFDKDITLANPAAKVVLDYHKTSIAEGTSADQCDLCYVARRTIADSGTADTFDLAGSLTDPMGSTLVFAEVNLFIIWNLHATSIYSVGAGSNPFINWVMASGDGVKVRPGGIFCMYAPDSTGYAVTAGTGDVVTVATNAGTSVTYDVLIAGRSA
jgi:hypothetical protein